MKPPAQPHTVPDTPMANWLFSVGFRPTYTAQTNRTYAPKKNAQPHASGSCRVSLSRRANFHATDCFLGDGFVYDDRSMVIIVKKGLSSFRGFCGIFRKTTWCQQTYLTIRHRHTFCGEFGVCCSCSCVLVCKLHAIYNVRTVFFFETTSTSAHRA